MKIRSGSRTDVAAVAALHTASWRSAYAGIMPARYLDGPLYEERLGIWGRRLGAPTPGAALFLAEDESGVIGFVYLMPCSDGRILLDNLHVRPSGKRLGTGSLLFRRALDWVRAEHPGRTLYLEVLEENTPAIAFYERRGGVRTDRRVAHFDQGFELIELEYAWPVADEL